MRKLVIAEKPSVASAIATALGGDFEHRSGYLERADLVITWAFGHIVRYADPEAYGDQYKGAWRMDVLPILPERFKLVPDEAAKDQLRLIIALLRQPFDAVINACDSGREGEHIFRLIYAISGSQLPVERLWTASMNPEGILDAWSRLRPGSQFNQLAASAQARAESDWLVGMNLTRAFSVHHGSLLSCGRVQTPVLALIVAREQEIEQFQPQLFWELTVTFANPAGTYGGKWVREDTDRFTALPDARAVQQKVAGQAGQVTKVERKERRIAPPPLFDLTSLQREMNRRYGFTAQKTLDIAQALYEKHKVITYPRTDSRFLTGDMLPRLGTLVRSLQGRFPQETARLLDGRSLKAAHVINDKKVTDHHAIIPTGVEPKDLSPDEARVFDAIARRFLAVFYPAHTADVTVIWTEVAGETFRSRGAVITELGWKELYPSDASGSADRAGDEGGGAESAAAGGAEGSAEGGADEADGAAADAEDAQLPPVTEGSVSNVTDTDIAARQTKPPARYTEAAILAAMEKAGKFVEASNLREALKSRGLGTPATRAAIIERLKSVGYVRLERKHLVPTEKGRLFIAAVPLPTLRSPEMTACWEHQLTRIEEGEGQYRDFVASIRAFVTEGVRTIALSPQIEALRRGAAGDGAEALGTCPVCGSGSIRQRKAQSGAFYGCDRYPECKFTLPAVLCSKHLTPAVIRELLQKRQTRQITGFKSPKSGAAFSAQLALGEDGRLQFVFQDRGGNGGDDAGEPVGSCPLCQQPVRKRSAGSGVFYGCTGYPQCRFSISGTILQRPISPAEAQALLRDGRTDLLDGFVGKKGKFRAQLVLQGGTVQFHFPARQ